ncbi:MAG: hypothetical protein HY533_04630 [Chloroflexi bacterium]|nr:hypothetical protein [Chloroflexota bacterium]
MQRIVTSLFLVLLLAATMAHDTLSLTSVQQLATPYHFNFLLWEAAHLPSKWTHLLFTSLLPYQQRDAEKLARMQEYFRLQEELSSLQVELSQAAATASAAVPELEQRLRGLQERIASLRPYAEETLESLVSGALRQEGVPLRLGKAVFPPVDYALVDLPTILIVSPRDRIERQASHLLVPEMPPSARSGLEEAILVREDLSAIVEDIGGLSTYPAIIQATDLRWALAVASHEWLHNYLFFHPLGLNIQRDGDMFSLNETTANIFGDELGNRIFSRLTGEPEPPPPQPSEPVEPCPQDRFCFGQQMRETRLRADELLAAGRIEEAEEYMEERRQAFVANGYYLRRINQAYFAFHGTYADSPSSVSPIYQQLLEVRQASPSLTAFIHTMQGVSSYEEFLGLRQRLVAQP